MPEVDIIFFCWVEAERQLRPIIHGRLVELQNQPEPSGRSYYKRIENERRAEELHSLQKVKDSLDLRLTADYAFDCLKNASGEVSRKVNSIIFKTLDCAHQIQVTLKSQTIHFPKYLYMWYVS